MQSPSVHPILWLVDASPSVNHLSEEAVRGTIQLTAGQLSDFLRDHPQIEIVTNVIFFGEEVVLSESDWKPINYLSAWSLNHQKTPGSNLAPALTLATRILRDISDSLPWSPSLIVLISDGWFTDDESRLGKAFRELLSSEMGRLAARISVAIGDAANLTALERFQNDPSIPVLNDENASAELVKRFYDQVSASDDYENAAGEIDA